MSEYAAVGRKEGGYFESFVPCSGTLPNFSDAWIQANRCGVSHLVATASKGSKEGSKGMEENEDEGGEKGERKEKGKERRKNSEGWEREGKGGR
eukprot:1247987-Rhodomonas_salina.1